MWSVCFCDFNSIYNLGLMRYVTPAVPFMSCYDWSVCRLTVTISDWRPQIPPDRTFYEGLMLGRGAGLTTGGHLAATLLFMKLNQVFIRWEKKTRRPWSIWSLKQTNVSTSYTLIVFLWLLMSTYYYLLFFLLLFIDAVSIFIHLLLHYCTFPSDTNGAGITIHSFWLNLRIMHLHWARPVFLLTS